MIYEINLEGNVATAAAAGATALRAEGEAAGQTLAELSRFRGAAAGLEESTKAAQALAGALSEIAKARASQSPAFSASTADDFKRSKWEQGAPTAGGGGSTPAASGAASGAATGKGAAAGAAKVGSALAGVGKMALAATAAMVAFGAAKAGLHSVADLTQMAIGWRTMGQLQMLSFKASMDLRRAVAGVDSKPLVRAFSLLETNLSKTTVTGNALSGILTRGYNAFFSSVEKLAPTLSEAFQLGVLGALKLEGAWLDLRLATLPLVSALGPLADAIGSLIGPLDTSGQDSAFWVTEVRGMTIVAQAAADAVNALSSGLKAYNTGTWAINAKENLGMISPAEADRQRKAVEDVQTKPIAAKDMGSAMAGAGGMTGEELSKQMAEARKAGEDIADGIVDGINAKLPAVAAAGRAAGKAATGGARDGAESHSPSEATKRTGRDVDAGMVLGIERDLPRVEAAGASVGEAATAGPAKGAAGSSSPAAGNAAASPAGISIGQLGPFTVEVRGGSSESMLSQLRAMAPELAQEILRVLSMRTGLPVAST